VHSTLFLAWFDNNRNAIVEQHCRLYDSMSGERQTFANARRLSSDIWHDLYSANQITRELSCSRLRVHCNVPSTYPNPSFGVLYERQCRPQSSPDEEQNRNELRKSIICETVTLVSSARLHRADVILFAALIKKLNHDVARYRVSCHERIARKRLDASSSSRSDICLTCFGVTSVYTLLSCRHSPRGPKRAARSHNINKPLCRAAPSLFRPFFFRVSVGKRDYAETRMGDRDFQTAWLCVVTGVPSGTLTLAACSHTYTRTRARARAHVSAHVSERTCV